MSWRGASFPPKRGRLRGTPSWRPWGPGTAAATGRMMPSWKRDPDLKAAVEAACPDPARGRRRVGETRGVRQGRISGLTQGMRPLEEGRSPPPGAVDPPVGADGRTWNGRSLDRGRGDDVGTGPASAAASGSTCPASPCKPAAWYSVRMPTMEPRHPPSCLRHRQTGIPRIRGAFRRGRTLGGPLLGVGRPGHLHPERKLAGRRLRHLESPGPGRLGGNGGRRDASVYSLSVGQGSGPWDWSFQAVHQRLESAGAEPDREARGRAGTATRTRRFGWRVRPWSEGWPPRLPRRMPNPAT